ncbi:glycosyltransferase family 4 protein [candidate division KSB1 bacterium]|nr:glycosyltransferase family 4 protein [candidate division KSB1 bacterium]NIR71064.1 glycosyltransferase family 4 protein [candidate division KSB1 bacterium]NIS24768.1 glycosyltransferase family 4 protein [candidate division KSB1 bacterium]NIT71673.1 glycosyltransferase family 4 protein [candidate division KSB1 bacterium]NIU25380.1 glycosyltransferase family 4 protein [candidate division KSB1 bacterium]
MPNLLYITYDYYPSASVAAKRAAKFCKYLPAYEFRPIVLTVKEQFYDAIDPTLDSNGVPTYRTSILKSHRPTEPTNVLPRLSYYLLRIIEKHAFPDPYIFWVPFAYKMAKTILARHQVDLIYATGPWFSSFFLGHLLKKNYGIPLVIEFRDQWSLNVVYRRGMRAKLHTHCDLKILQVADKVIFASEGFLREYQACYSNVDFSKATVIPNGFDPDDFAASNGSKSNRFTITYAGNFYWPRTPDNFLKALLELKIEGKINADNFKFLSLGNLDESMVCWPEIKDVLELKNLQSHKETLMYLSGSDLLLLIVAPGHEANIPAKLYEYLAADKPILLLSPKGATSAKIIRETERGLIANINDIADIKAKLYQMVRTIQTSSCAFDGDKVAKYSCLRTTEQLADELAMLC